MSNKYDISVPLLLLKKYVAFTFKRYYGEYIVVGKENIPSESPIIFAPNHLNALMDALAVHCVVPQNLPVTFLARSDIFNHKKAARFLNFIKMLPAFRMRDGVENLGKNNEIFEQCVEILHHNKALGIMPEGNQGEERKLRPLLKGIFRIAFAAQQKYGTNPSVKIIPIGIDVGDFTKFGKHILICIGKPIEVSEYMARYDENPVTATNELRDRLQNDLNSITLNLASENHYSCFETAVEVANTAIVEELHLPKGTIYRFVARQKIAERLLTIEKNDPQKIEELAILCEDYSDCLQKMNLRTWLLEQTAPKIGSLLLDGCLLICTSPVFVQGFILNILPFWIPMALRKAMKVKYTGFFSSIQYVFGAITFPFFYFLQTILFSLLTNLPWWTAVLFFFSQYIVGKWAFGWYKEAIKLRAKIHFLRLERKKSPRLQQAKMIRKKIIELIKQ